MLQLGMQSLLTTTRELLTAVDLSGMKGVDATGFSGYTIVTKVRRAENLVGGSYVRLVIHAPNTADGSLSAVYFGEAATSGNAYDFAASPTQVTFNGAGSLTLTAHKVFVSDPIAVDFDPAKAHLVAMNVSSSALRRFTSPEVSRGVTSFYRAATSEASSTTKTAGYTARANTSFCLATIKALKTPAIGTGEETPGEEEV